MAPRPCSTSASVPFQVASVDLKARQFALASVSATADTRIPLDVGAHLPDFTFTDFGGTRRQLPDLKGRYVLLDFWATWCSPCMADLPKLKESYTAFHPKGFEILGIDGYESPDRPQSVIQQKGLTWPQARYDADLIENRFQISQWPSGGQRTIVSIGRPDHLPLDGDHLAATLTTLLAQKQSREKPSGQ
jgi:thiol-disulfide isomerase/thioredoxin